ncbi:hypothetical protein MRX96_033082 [Rhipicephalus microplus]
MRGELLLDSKEHYGRRHPKETLEWQTKSSLPLSSKGPPVPDLLVLSITLPSQVSSRAAASAGCAPPKFNVGVPGASFVAFGMAALPHSLPRVHSRVSAATAGINAPPIAPRPLPGLQLLLHLNGPR